MPAVFIRFAASMKNGIARSRNELYDLRISFSSKNGVSRSSRKKTGTHASPNANATGTRRMMSSAKTPKRIAATSAGPMVELQVVQDFLEEEQRPADAREWPGDVDRKHVDARHLRFLLETEQREAPAKGDEDERDQEHRDMHDDAGNRLAMRRPGCRQHIDVEVRPVAHRDDGAQHDQPHQAEPDY